MPEQDSKLVPSNPFVVGALRLGVTSLFLAAVVAAAGPTLAADRDCMVQVGGVHLQSSTVPEIQAALADGTLTSRALVERYLQRIAFFDTAGAKLNSIRELNSTALAQADILDAERRAGKVRGPLHGIPVLFKDNIGTSDMPTTAGSIALEGAVPFRNSSLVDRLRWVEGAIVLGKTNLSEFANWMDLSMPSGYSSLGGQVLNAYNQADSPSGSSAGSGVATSMALSTVSVGTETSGSIISPSWTNSIVGLKPTLGLISRAGVIPLAESFDTPGPMTRTVTDAAVLLGAMTGIDERDQATYQSAGHVPPGSDYTPFLRHEGLFGARLGFDVSNRPSGERGMLWDQALADLRAAGAQTIPIDGLDTTSLVGVTEIAAIPNEFKAGINRYLLEEARPTPTGVENLTNIIDYNEQHPDRVRYGQSLLIASDLTLGNTEPWNPVALANKEAAIQASRAAIDAAFALSALDAVIAPNSTYVNVGAAAGYPTITVPAGYTNNGSTPLNVSFMGQAWDEPHLLGFAYAYEQQSMRRVPPTAVNPTLFPNGCTIPAAA